MKRLLLALDADGVLLDYNRTFGKIWTQHYGQKMECVEPRAYHAVNYWGVQAPDRDAEFWSVFDAIGWKNMLPMAGALEACHLLHDAGHELVCVSSMPVHRQADRLANLQALGFPIDRVIATGSCPDPHANPKRQVIEELAPDWFVDDELRKLKDLPGVNCVLVDPGHPDTPNVGQADDFLRLRVHNLLEFAQKMVSGSIS